MFLAKMTKGEFVFLAATDSADTAVRAALVAWLNVEGLVISVVPETDPKVVA